MFFGRDTGVEHKSSTKCTVPAQIFVGPRAPYDRKVESPHLLLRVFEARTLLISNPGDACMKLRHELFITTRLK